MRQQAEKNQCLSKYSLWTFVFSINPGGFGPEVIFGKEIEFGRKHRGVMPPATSNGKIEEDCQ